MLEGEPGDKGKRLRRLGEGTGAGGDLYFPESRLDGKFYGIRIYWVIGNRDCLSHALGEHRNGEMEGTGITR